MAKHCDFCELRSIVLGCATVRAVVNFHFAWGWICMSAGLECEDFGSVGVNWWTFSRELACSLFRWFVNILGLLSPNQAPHLDTRSASLLFLPYSSHASWSMTSALDPPTPSSSWNSSDPKDASSQSNFTTPAPAISMTIAMTMTTIWYLPVTWVSTTAAVDLALWLSFCSRGCWRGWTDPCFSSSRRWSNYY